MSGLLMRWVNEGLVLSRHVTSFERDFSNGYLFGEVLAKFNQQPDFSTDFEDSTKSNARISNFCRLEPTFRRLRYCVLSTPACLPGMCTPSQH